jgi:hypothetical protein
VIRTDLVHCGTTHGALNVTRHRSTVGSSNHPWAVEHCRRHQPVGRTTGGEVGRQLGDPSPTAAGSQSVGQLSPKNRNALRPQWTTEAILSLIQIDRSWAGELQDHLAADHHPDG